MGLPRDRGKADVANNKTFTRNLVEVEKSPCLLRAVFLCTVQAKET